MKQFILVLSAMFVFASTTFAQETQPQKEAIETTIPKPVLEKVKESVKIDSADIDTTTDEVVAVDEVVEEKRSVFDWINLLIGILGGVLASTVFPQIVMVLRVLVNLTPVKLDDQLLEGAIILLKRGKEVLEELSELDDDEPSTLAKEADSFIKKYEAKQV